ncbi:DNA repair protein rad8, partial [Clarias magur]
CGPDGFPLSTKAQVTREFVRYHGYSSISPVLCHYFLLAFISKSIYKPVVVCFLFQVLQLLILFYDLAPS